MTKYLLLLSLASCMCNPTATKKRLKEEANDACSCHGGLDLLTMTNAEVNVSCKDHTRVIMRLYLDVVMNARLDDVYMIGGCK